MAKRIVLVGGGSGGHIFPLVAVAKEFKKQHPNTKFLYMGSNSPMRQKAEEAMTKEDIKTTIIFSGKIRRYFSFRTILDLLFIPLGIIQSLIILLIYMPDAVFSKGGHDSVPVVLAAWIYRIPVLTHDSDAIPGWANRFCGRLSKYVAISYERSRKYFFSYKTLLTGNPIREELTQGDVKKARERWGFSESKPVVFVTGGSQGARLINNSIIKILGELTHVAQVLHVTGPKNYDRVKKLAGEYGFRTDRHRYVAVPFLERDEMADAYAFADVVISRSGANSITEIAANKKPSILIPLASAANNHQYMNGFEIARMGGAVVLEEGNLTRHVLLEKIKKLILDKELAKQMSEKSSGFYNPNSAKEIVEGIDKMMK